MEYNKNDPRLSKETLSALRLYGIEFKVLVEDFYYSQHYLPFMMDNDFMGKTIPEMLKLVAEKICELEKEKKDKGEEQ